MKYHSIENEPQLVKSLSKGNLLAFSTLFSELKTNKESHACP